MPPTLRVLTWNIQTFSEGQTRIPGMVDALAHVIFFAGGAPDVVIILEVQVIDGPMPALAQALNRLAGGNLYQTYLQSGVTGDKERYGVVVKDLNRVRPLAVQGPIVDQPVGTDGDPLRNLTKNVFVPWPAPFGIDLPGGAGPRVPLLETFVEPINFRRPKKIQRITGRKPALCPLLVRDTSTSPATVSFVPLVAWHFSAVRSSIAHNFTAQGQLATLKQLHIAQMYLAGEHVAVQIGGQQQPFLVGDLAVVGDFNVDFRRNEADAAPNGPFLWAHQFYHLVTDAYYDAGSAISHPTLPNPKAAPALPFGPPPNAPFATEPDRNDLVAPTLKAGNTTTGTILQLESGPPPEPPFTTANFDNCFYAGRTLSRALTPPAPPQPNGDQRDAVHVISVPDLLVPALDNVAPPNLSLAALASALVARRTVDINRPGTTQAQKERWQQWCEAMSLLYDRYGVQHGLSNATRLFGARALSDHLPVVIDFPFAGP